MTEERLLEIVESCSTPFYLFDGETLRRRVEYLRTSLPPSVSLCYAVKANPFLTGELAGLMDRLEICSPGELRICQRLELPREKFVVSGVSRSPTSWPGSSPSRNLPACTPWSLSTSLPCCVRER